MKKPAPVVNRKVTDVVRHETAVQAGIAGKRKSTKTRVREVIGGAGVVLTIGAGPVETAQPKLRGQNKAKQRLIELDPAREAVLRDHRRRRARQLIKILSHHLERFEKREHLRLPKTLVLRYLTNDVVKEKTEEQLMDLILAELCGACRSTNLLRLHAEYSRKRSARERRELLDTFFEPEAISATLRKWYTIK